MTNKHYFFKTFRYMKPYKFGYGIGTFLFGAQDFAFSFMSSIFYGGAVAAVLNSSFSEVLDTVWLVAIMFLVFSFLVGAGAYLHTVNVTYALRDIRIDIFKAFTKVSIESQKHSGDGVALINTDVNIVADIFDGAFIPFLSNVITATFSAATVFVIDWRMGLGALVIGLGAFSIQSWFAIPLSRLAQEKLATKADSVKSLSNILAGALTIKAYNRQDHSLTQFDHINEKMKKLAFKQAFIGMWQSLFTTIQGWLTLVLVFTIGGWLVIRGQIEFHQIMMVLPLSTAISTAMSAVGTTFAGLQTPIVAAKRIFELVDSAPVTEKSQGGKITDWNGKYDININKLSFSYKDGTNEALNDIDLLIGENEMIAFVGKSGSGKSTLLRTIIGMYEQDGLNMEIGETSFTVENINEWRSHFAYVDQSCKLFDMSIAENIAMGLQGEIQDNQIQEAAKHAFAHDFISELPEGYSTACGEKGVSLSGGQKQRIAIARALYRKAPVLVFDEATASLDMESERSIMATIDHLRHSHTILITSHNLNSIATANKIVVMDNGRIAEFGTHAELLEIGGLYTKLLAESHVI